MYMVVLQAELRRCYTQIELNRMKSMRKDNAHIPRKKGGRKHASRRFSLQAFKHRHTHAHAHKHAMTSELSMDHDTEISRTPEESSNSAECGVSMTIDDGASDTPCRTRAVHFSKSKK